VLRAVLLDFNGVLVDDEPIHLRLLLRVLAEEGLEVAPEWARESFFGVDDRDCLERAFARSGRALDELARARLVARKASYYQEEIRRAGYPIVPGAAAAVRSLAAAGFSLGVVSGALRHEVEGALRAAAIRERIAVVVAAEDVALGKPDAEGYRRALMELQRAAGGTDRMIHPHEVVAVEDSPAGAAAALAAGLRLVAVAARGRPLAGAEGSVVSLAELTPERLRALVPDAA